MGVAVSMLSELGLFLFIDCACNEVPTTLAPCLYMCSLGSRAPTRRTSPRAPPPPPTHGTPPLPCAESDNLRSSFPHQTRITMLNYHGYMAMVMVAAAIPFDGLMALMMKMTPTMMMLSKDDLIVESRLRLEQHNIMSSTTGATARTKIKST